MSSSQVVARFMGYERVVLSPVLATPTITWAPQLVFSPGFYSHNGLVYDLTQPGHYVFFNPMVNTTRMTVAAGDPVAILSATSWMTTFGDDDVRASSETEAAFIARVSVKARTSKLKLLCGNTIEFTRSVLASAGFQSRTVRLVTMETPNNYVDGHVCVETKVGGEWALGDVSLNVMFEGGGGLLSAKDAVSAIACDEFDYRMLAEDGYAVEPANSYQFDSTGYAEAFLLTPQDRRDWHRRIFQAVGIDHPNGEVWWLLPPGSEGRASWVLGLQANFRVKTLAEFNAAFYP